MARAEEYLDAVDELARDGARRGLFYQVLDDVEAEGRCVRIDGRSLLSFGSCSYLGLETHPALIAAVHAAVDRFGTQFSSSRAYAATPLYRDAEESLSTIFERPTLVTASTTLASLAALPVLVGSRDVLLMDHQVHASVQTAAKVAQAGGARVELLPHGDVRTLAKKLAAYRRTARKVWFAADGVYSMYADFLPAAELDELVAENPHLWLYVDDAHGVSWSGRNGRGVAHERLAPATLERTVVAASLNKSFAAAGGALTFPDEELRGRVLRVGGPMIFAGPVQPPMLGAVVASAKLHLTREVAGRQALLLDRIQLFNRLAEEAGLPVTSPSEAPIRCVAAGLPRVAYRLVERLRDAGFHVNTATFPAVPARRSGVRLALTAHHTEDDVAAAVTALAHHLPAALADEGVSLDDVHRAFGPKLRTRWAQLPAPAAPRRRRVPLRRGLTLEVASSIAGVDHAEWDRLLGARGAFDAAALAAYEAAFSPVAGGRPEDSWQFAYWTVRDAVGRPVAATFATSALWPDDALSPPEVSREVARQRAAHGDPYYLTSRTVATGSLLTEGEHLWLDRDGDWRGALQLLLSAARELEDASGASSVVLRDLPDGDEELAGFLRDEGLVRLPMPDSWERQVTAPDDESFLAGLPRKHRYHQRTRVLGWEPAYRVEVVQGGSPEAAALTTAQRDELYALYRAVHVKAFELAVFPLPRRLLDAVLASPAFELVLLHLPDRAPGPVAFSVQHRPAPGVHPRTLSGVFIGMDYAYVASANSYQQLLLQALRSAQRDAAAQGPVRLMLGMGSDLQKARFGAQRQRRWAWVQATDTFNAAVLEQLAGTVGALSP